MKINKNGHICVKNYSAYLIPELTLQREIGGTVYMVTGSYSGCAMLDQKLLRVMVQSAENMEDSG